MRESYKELGMTDEEFENLRLTPVYNWFIAISKDRKEVIICPDIKERTQFARSLGPEYIYAVSSKVDFHQSGIEKGTRERVRSKVAKFGYHYKFLSSF